MARGSVVKKSGAYNAVYRVDGKQKWEKAGRTKAMAEKLLIRRMDEIHSGDFCDIKPRKFSEFVEIWLRETVRPNLKESTYTLYKHFAEKHMIPAFGDGMIHKIATADVHSFIASLSTEHGLSPKSVLNVFTQLRGMFKTAKLLGFIRKDPMEGLSRPRAPRNEMDFLTPEEVSLFLEHVSPDYRVFFTTAILTGMRQGELIGLQWGDINWKTSELIVRRSAYQGKFVSTKTKGSVRRVSLSPRLLRLLEGHYKAAQPESSSEPVFVTKRGTALNPKNMVNREFHPALKRAGLRRIRFHELRHTNASLLIAQGENVKYIQSQLGHASAATTLDLYSHLMPGTQIDAGLKLDRTVFGSRSQSAVRKLLENPESGTSQRNSSKSEVIESQVTSVANAE